MLWDGMGHAEMRLAPANVGRHADSVGTETYIHMHVCYPILWDSIRPLMLKTPTGRGPAEVGTFVAFASHGPFANAGPGHPSTTPPPILEGGEKALALVILVLGSPDCLPLLPGIPCVSSGPSSTAICWLNRVRRSISSGRGLLNHGSLPKHAPSLAWLGPLG
jgi:hypothetical protein